jgi:hypothetical protein
MRKELIQITRDRRIVIISFIQPIIMLFQPGFAVTKDVRSQAMALVIFAIVIMGVAMLRFRNRLD